MPAFHHTSLKTKVMENFNHVWDFMQVSQRITVAILERVFFEAKYGASLANVKDVDFTGAMSNFL